MPTACGIPTGQDQPGTAALCRARHGAKHSGRALLDKMARGSPCGAGQECMAPLSLVFTQKLSQATRTTRGSPTGCTARSLPATHTPPRCRFTQGSGQRETPATPEEGPSVQGTWRDGLRCPLSLWGTSSENPPLCREAREAAWSLSICPSIHPPRAGAASASSRVSCSQLLSQALKRRHHGRGCALPPHPGKRTPRCFLLPWLRQKALGPAMGDVAFPRPSYCGYRQGSGASGPSHRHWASLSVLSLQGEGRSVSSDLPLALSLG